MNILMKAIRAVKSWFESPPVSPDERPLNIARSPSGSDFPKPMMIARMPVTPLSEMNIARTPGSVEVLSPSVQVLPAQRPVPGQTIDGQTQQELITRDKNFF